MSTITAGCYIDETRVSGCIYAKKDRFHREGEMYMIRSPNGKGWGLPVDHMQPEDLRALADRIELKRKE